MAHIHSLLSLFFIIYIIVYTLACGSCLVSDVAKSGLYSSRMQGQVQTIKSSKILYQHRAGHLTISCSTFDGDLVDMYTCAIYRNYLLRNVLQETSSLEDDEAYSNTLITS
ncbi:unnamed protein product [Fusarium graminearum]|uniref:Uncharacterized protein n=1 Tax=Gibberella zeae TaxID=5518 RepID=A0A4E9D531_GIBZA|nr:unnamed protein product [Fusarium graminearum]CAF3508869.1 unnamed protein product [Fusarium graminearum]CAG1988525.1 unnamed protein product [Fusarium graminearum]CAG1996538.1 unnamed protein product [Fusarium graminearum]